MTLTEILANCKEQTDNETLCVTQFLLQAAKNGATLQECHKTLGIEDTQYFSVKHVRPLKEALFRALWSKKFNDLPTEEQITSALAKTKPEDATLLAFRNQVNNLVPKSAKRTKIDKLTDFVQGLI